MKVAAYQAPLLIVGTEALDLVRTQVKRCELECITILCCREAILGGLADNHPIPSEFAIAANSTTLKTTLSPLASEPVTTIIGFAELGDGGRIYNSAAVLQRGEIVGLYRKVYPAIRRSVYSAGHGVPIFRIGELTFGIAVFLQRLQPSRIGQAYGRAGATALFVPTNNGLPANRNGAELAAKARKCDLANAVENRMSVIRADVAGHAGGLVSYGSSEIVDPEGIVLRSARPVTEDLVIADIDTVRRTRRRGMDTSRIALSRHPWWSDRTSC